MSLTPTQRWKDTAAAGSAEPVLMFEVKPTVMYEEANFFGDWQEGQSSANLNINEASNDANAKRDSMTLGATDELRLQTADVEAAAQTKQGGAIADLSFWGWHPLPEAESTGEAGNAIVQVVSFSKAFQVKKLYIGLYNNNAKYKGSTTISIYGNLDLKKQVASTTLAAAPPFVPPYPPDYDINTTEIKNPSEVYRLFAGHTPLFSQTIDHDKDGLSQADGGPEGETGSTAYATSNTAEVYVETRGSGASQRTLYWRVLDLTEKNIWLPGGNTPCALLIQPKGDAANLLHLQALGSNSRDDYTGGDFYKYTAAAGLFECPDASLAFKFLAYGYTSSEGTAYWQFEQDRDIRAGEVGDLEIRYCQPKGTSIVFEKRESGTEGGLADLPWQPTSDGKRLSQKFAQVRVKLNADSANLDTPRLYSIRCAFKRTDTFLLASETLFGYPNCVAEAPDFSFEGDPVSGSARSTDTSQIKMLDPGGMISNMFAEFPLKNDRIKISLGFNTSAFTEADYLPFKTVWIEDWQPGDGIVTIHGYDQHVKFRELKIPTSSDPPEQTEKIHYDDMSPAAILIDLLMRARMRLSEIDCDSTGDPQSAGSFYNLHTKYDWSLDHIVEKPRSPQDIAKDLCRHFLGWLSIDETGKWVSRYVDFDASPDSDTEALSGNDIIVDSETYVPGLKALRNIGVVFFGGTGNDQTKYRKVAIGADPDRTSEKKYGEHKPDHLLSNFIPLDTDENDVDLIPMNIANNRRILQQDGYRSIEFSTPLRFAHLRVGDHISFTSTHYKRAGMTDLDTANPLLVILTFKNINPNLEAIHWRSIVLLDNEQAATMPDAVAVPEDLVLTMNGDGTISWDFNASDDDDGTAGQKYEMFQRLAARTAWEQPKIVETADGSASYTVEDSVFSELVRYDFGIRFVNENGRKSAMVVDSDNLLTMSAPGTPGTSDWEVNPVAGGVEVWVSDWDTNISDAHHVRVYREAPDTPAGRYIIGRIYRNTDRKDTFIFPPPNPYQPKLWTFSLAGVNKWLQAGTRSALKRMVNFGLPDPTLVLDAPTLASGTYPLISYNPVGPYQAFTLTNKITAPDDQADLVDYYELQRRDDSGSLGESTEAWTDWEAIPPDKLKQNDASQPGAVTLYYRNTDRYFRVDYHYQYRVRAVSKTGVPGTWSNTVGRTLADDTTGPDQPTVTLTQVSLGNRLIVSAPAQASGVCPDVAFCVIQGYESVAAAWVTLATQSVGSEDGSAGGVDWVHRPNDGDIGETWKYRVKYVDHSDNSSSWSSETSAVTLGYGTKIQTSGGDDSLVLSGTGQANERFECYAGGNLAYELKAFASGSDYYGVAWHYGELSSVTYKGRLTPSSLLFQAEDASDYRNTAQLSASFIPHLDLTGQDDTYYPYQTFLRTKADYADISDGNILGRTFYKGRVNSSSVTFADIYISAIDADTGTEDARIYIGLISGGSLDADAFVLDGTGYLDLTKAAGELRINGTKVVDSRQAFIADATGGATVDTECRAVQDLILDLLIAHGLMAAA